MPKKSLMVRSKRKPKYATQQYNRCQICGRSGSYLRRFKLCRICFRNLALNGELPGVLKSSW
ncbi:type Z 30S ribosomal protein S14 [Patescibacteria group bacterium]|nr:type Z 30S ribosomal protein S14 [Patescibacteria group bacterium]MBU1867873.1 type Z 30S ribosomal protein S14 [Patescibacteria group bacterium]